MKEEKASGERENLQVCSRKQTPGHIFNTHPKQKSAAVKIVRNIPSLTIEEATPVSTINLPLIVPVEIMEKEKGELKEEEDMEKTDKNR